ncbi:hypothetical protein V8F33_010705 [Rhypophila sp. PSN 637]
MKTALVRLAIHMQIVRVKALPFPRSSRSRSNTLRFMVRSGPSTSQVLCWTSWRLWCMISTSYLTRCSSLHPSSRRHFSPNFHTSTKFCVCARA